MKKLFSFSALCALLYAMPMSANYSLGNLLSIITELPIPSTLITAVLIILIQALLFRHFLNDISYGRALLIVFVGNIPSTGLGLITTFPNMHRTIHHCIYSLTFSYPLASTVSLILIDFLLMLGTTFLLFRYPFKRLLISTLLGTIAAYLMLAVFIMMNYSCR